MASHLIDTGNITTFANNTANAPAALNTTLDEIVDTYNAAFHASTGHSHSGATGDAPSISSGVGSLTVTELGILFFAHGGY